MTTDQIVGVDLGSLNCRIAWPTKDVSSMKKLPFAGARLSASVCFHGGDLHCDGGSRKESSGDSSVTYGTVKADLDHGFQKLVGDAQVSSVKIAETLLQAAVAKARESFGSSPTAMVVAYPPTYDVITQETLRTAARSVGINSISLISESVAAAWAAKEQGINIVKSVLICDLGASGATISALVTTADGNFDSVVTSRFVADGGGNAMDQVIYNHVAAARANGNQLGGSIGRIDEALLSKCRAWKESIDKGGAEATATAEEWVGMDQSTLEKIVRKCLEPVHRAIVQMFKELNARGIHVGSVLLVGGGAKQASVLGVLEKDITPKPVVVPLPDQAVALGCAAYGAPRKKRADEHCNPLASKKFAEFKEKYERDARSRPLVLLLAGRTGVGKSSTVNSLMGRVVAPVGHSEACTFEVHTYEIDIQGIKIRVVDTPGLCDKPAKESNDDYYIRKMRDAIGQIDALLYVTDLQRREPDADELRALRVLSNAFERKGEIWRTSVIAFTHANTSSLTLDIFQQRMLRRTQDFHRIIGSHAGDAIAISIPVVAVENTADTTLDGKDWRAELYTQVCLRMANEAFATWIIATKDNATTPTASLWDDDDTIDEAYSSSRHKRRDRDSSASIRLSEDQAGAIQERMKRDFVQKYESGGRRIGDIVGLGDAGAWVGRKIGEWLWG
jgi:actin-like ATPase involved in cell morphogenesis/ribosome biogenesis GTPase A